MYEYRELQDGECTKDGDEYYDSLTDLWHLSIVQGYKIGSVPGLRYRRPIVVKSIRKPVPVDGTMYAQY